MKTKLPLRVFWFKKEGLFGLCLGRKRHRLGLYAGRRDTLRRLVRDVPALERLAGRECVP